MKFDELTANITIDQSGVACLLDHLIAIKMTQIKQLKKDRRKDTVRKLIEQKKQKKLQKKRRYSLQAKSGPKSAADLPTEGL